MIHTKLKLIAFAFCFSFCLQAQTLSGDYQGFLYQNYYVGKYSKGKFVLIDSLKLDDKGTFTKQLNPKIYTPNTLYVVASEGEYKERKNIDNPHPHNSIRFLYLGKDVSYTTSWRQETGYLNFTKGGEPSNHIKELNSRLQKTQALLTQMEQLLELLEPNDPFYNQIMTNYMEKATAFNTYCQSIAAQYPKGSYMNLYASMYQQVVPQKGMSLKDFQAHRAKNVFMFTDLKNPLVANVPILSAMYSSYLYQNQPTGMVASDAIQKMQDDAKTYLQKNAAKEVLEALNMQDFRPQVQIMRERLTKDINFDTLYQNKEEWFAQINDVLGAYDVKAPYHALFAKDIITALERTKKPEAYTMLAEAAFSITDQFGWTEAQEELVKYLVDTSDPRLQKGSGKVAQIYALKGLSAGSKAPDLVIKTTGANGEPQTKVLKSGELASGNYKQSLIIFYETGCGHCDQLMQMLPAQYEVLKSKGIRVISIAADLDKAGFAQSSKNFPWADKYCDFEGKAGVNFKNFAAVGTPTLYLLDREGKVLKRGSTLEEML